MEKLLEKLNINSKKGIENLVIFLVLVIIVMVVINGIFNEEEEKIIPTVNTQIINENKDTFEKKLEDILTTISGVRKSKSNDFIYKQYRENTNIRYKRNNNSNRRKR